MTLASSHHTREEARAPMGNCSVKGTIVFGAGCDGGENAEADELDAPRRVKDIISPGACKASASAGRPRSAEAFKKLEVLPSPEKGVWRVRMAISSEQLAEILSEQANTEAMIERMRSYASTAEAAQKQSKCKRVADWMIRHEELNFPC